MTNHLSPDPLLYKKIEQLHYQLHHAPSQLAQEALLKEVHLSPKPGLVDQWDTGSHADMDLTTFLLSIIAITPYLDKFYAYGIVHSSMDSASFLAGIRPLGVECEEAMLTATGQINCHRGAIFAFGLILATMGRLYDEDVKLPNIETISKEIACICYGLVERELVPHHGHSMGERLFQEFGLTGARGEAESGYALVRNNALPYYLHCISRGYTQEHALLEVMLYLFSVNNDTNIVARGGMPALLFVKTQAQELLSNCPMSKIDLISELKVFNQKMVDLHLSPGGSADLLAVTYFFVLLLGMKKK